VGTGSPRRDRANEDLTGALAAEAQSATADVEQARATRLDDLDVRAVADAEFGQATDPTRFAGHVLDFAPFAGAEQFQREQGVHGKGADQFASAIEIQSL
jgi:hypothetical protein